MPAPAGRRRGVPVRRASTLLAVAMLAIAACGGDDGGGGGTAAESTGKPLTIYSSLPLQGAARAQAEAAVKGAKLALEQAGAKVSPGNTAVGITSDDPGASPGEPDKYYPTGTRTYARVLPKDTYQGAALAALAKEEGCASAYILNDKEVYGAGLARNVELSSEKVGLDIKGNEGIDKNAPNYRSLGAKIKGTGAECFIYCGITANNAVQIFKDMAVALPQGALLGPEG